MPLGTPINPPAPGSLDIGELLINAVTRAMYVGVPASLDPSGVTLISDLLGLSDRIDTKADANATAVALSGKANTVHTHAISDITGLQTALNQLGGAVPPRGIIMWSGAIVDIPAGYVICNGANGTPNLQDKFVIGAGANYAAGTIGGTTSATNTTTSAGAHTHGAVTGGTAITIAQMASHSHGYSDPGHVHSVNDPGHQHSYNAGLNNITVNTGFAVSAAQQFGQNSGVAGTGISIVSNPVGITISAAGSNQPHTHSITSDGAHTHQLTVNTIPPYYALAFIMKLP